jgi:hypothetical protein
MRAHHQAAHPVTTRLARGPPGFLDFLDPIHRAHANPLT